METSQDDIRGKLKAILEGPPKVTQKSLAARLGISAPRLSHFLHGRDHADRSTEKTTIGGEGLQRVLQFLKAEYNWPPPFDRKAALEKLASRATRIRPP